MGRTLPSATQILQQNEEALSRSRRALRRSDQFAFDDLFTAAHQYIAEAAYSSHLLPFEVSLLCMLLEEHKTVMRLQDEISSLKISVPEFEGWILDIFEDPKDGLVLYIAAQNHQRYRLTTSFPITFYALGNNSELRSLWTYLRHYRPDLHLAKATRFDVIAQRQVPALAVTLPNPTEIRAFINHLESRYPSLNYADVDIPITVRFAAATGAYPLALCKIESDDQDRLMHIRPLESPWLINHKPIPLETLFISPNVDPQHKSPHFLQANIHHRGYRIGLNDWNITLTTLRRIIHRFNTDLVLTS